MCLVNKTKYYENNNPYPAKLPAPIDGEPGQTKDDLHKMRKEWRNDSYNLRMKLEKDCFEWAYTEIGGLTEEKFKIIWDKAWEDGHSSGYYEVTIKLEEMVGLIKNFIN
jgi:hypothetical protein